MTPRRVLVHFINDQHPAYPALLVDTRRRKYDHSDTYREEALIVRLDPDPDTAYAYDWVPLGRLEDAEDDIRSEPEPVIPTPDSGRVVTDAFAEAARPKHGPPFSRAL